MSETLELIKPSVIETALQQANLTDTVLAQLKEKYLSLKVTDKVTRKEADEARKDCKKIRVLTVNTCKEGREDAIKIQKDWIAAEKKVTGRISEVEEHLEAQIKVYDDAIAKEIADKERIKQERIQSRIALLIQAGCSFDGANYSIAELTINVTQIEVMNDGQWDSFCNSVSTKYNKIEEAKAEVLRLQRKEEERAANAKLAEEVRIKREREELEEQRAKFRAEQEKARQESEAKQKAIDEENERIAKKQREEREELQRQANAIQKQKEDAELAEKQRMLKIEQDRIDAENEKIRVENERIAAIDAENKRIQDEKDRIEAERLEGERQAALAPDKEKLIAFGDALGKVSVPKLESDAADKILADVLVLVSKIQNHIAKQVKTL